VCACARVCEHQWTVPPIVGRARAWKKRELALSIIPACDIVSSGGRGPPWEIERSAGRQHCSPPYLVSRGPLYLPRFRRFRRSAIRVFHGRLYDTKQTLPECNKLVFAVQIVSTFMRDCRGPEESVESELKRAQRKNVWRILFALLHRTQRYVPTLTFSRLSLQKKKLILKNNMMLSDSIGFFF